MLSAFTAFCGSGEWCLLALIGYRGYHVRGSPIKSPKIFTIYVRRHSVSIGSRYIFIIAPHNRGFLDKKLACKKPLIRPPPIVQGCKSAFKSGFKSSSVQPALLFWKTTLRKYDKISSKINNNYYINANYLLIEAKQLCINVMWCIINKALLLFIIHVMFLHFVF